MTSAIFGTMAAMAAMAALVLLQDPSANAPPQVYFPEAVALKSTAP